MYNPDVHNRQSIRLRDFDYGGAGAFFVTLCAWRRECLFGDVVDGRVRLNELGLVVRDCWTAVPQHFPHVELDEFVIMPNHLHVLFWIVDEYSPVGAQHAAPLVVHPKRLIDKSTNDPVGAQHAAPLPGMTTRAKERAQHAAPLRVDPRGGVTPNNVMPGSVAAIVRSFKSAATKRINALRDNAGCPLWQRNYYEHVIRGDRDLHAVRQYIADNPAKWELDTNHPTRI